MGAHGNEGTPPVEHWLGAWMPAWCTESHWEHPKCM